MALTTLFLTGVEISARMYRGLITDLFGEGIRNVSANEFRVIPRALGANMTVTIQKGTGEDAVAYIKGDDVTGQGTYRITHDADFLDLTVAAAPASGTRTDLVVLEVVDSQVVGGSTNLSRFRVLTGVSALTSEKTVIPLARISVPSGTTSIQAANITDLRGSQQGGGAAVRTAAQPLTAAQIAALTGMRVGDMAVNTDSGRVVFWNGTIWRAVGGGASGSTTIPATPLPANTAVTISVFIGVGFEEVAVTVHGSFAALVNANPATLVNYTGNAVQASTDIAAQFNYSSDSGTAQVNLTNVRLESDGYLRFVLTTASAGTLSARRINWRAR